MRGKVHIWQDNDYRLNIWSSTGHVEEENADRPGGVTIDMKIMDEYVVMRMAEMISSGTINTVIDNVVATNNNFGADRLKKLRSELKITFAKLYLSIAKSK